MQFPRKLRHPLGLVISKHPYGLVSKFLRCPRMLIEISEWRSDVPGTSVHHSHASTKTCKVLPTLNEFFEEYVWRCRWCDLSGAVSGAVCRRSRQQWRAGGNESEGLQPTLKQQTRSPNSPQHPRKPSHRQKHRQPAAPRKSYSR